MDEGLLIDRFLQQAESIVSGAEIIKLNDRLLQNNSFILMLGDCAEPMDKVNEEELQSFRYFNEQVSHILERSSNRQILKIARAAGQFGKSRTNDYEADGVTPTYQGDIINGFDIYARKAEGFRRVLAYYKSKYSCDYLKDMLYCAHELFDFDYEKPLLRTNDNSKYFASSAHLLWLGRKNIDSEEHLNFLAKVINPVGIKIDKNVTPSRLIKIIGKLKSVHDEKIIILISRIGLKDIVNVLPSLIKAGLSNRCIWICDPMHGNTKINTDGRKVRFLNDIIDEAKIFKNIYEDITGCKMQGIMLEANYGDFLECLDDESDARKVVYRSLCDPRLNVEQTTKLLRELLEIYINS